MSELESSASPTIQTQIMTRLLDLPRSISLQEHNEIINGYEFYLSAISEKLRVDLACIPSRLGKVCGKGDRTGTSTGSTA